MKLCDHLRSRGLLIFNNSLGCPTAQPTHRSGVLVLAKPDIQHIRQKLMGSDTVPHTAATTFRHYCQAILMWRHQLTASAVKTFCVNDWLDRKSVASGVCIQLNGSRTKRSIILTGEEEEFLECYLLKLRPLSLRRQDQDSDDKGRFFLGDSGLPLCNPSGDLRRLRDKYLQPVSEGPGADSVSDPPTGQASASMSMQEWDAFMKAFPMSLHGNAPSRDKCVEAGYPRYRPYYVKWRDLQLRQRASYMSRSLSKTSGRPHKASIQSALDKESWTTNRPLVHDVLKAWVPPERQLKDTWSILTSVMKQKWKGLAIKDFGMPKGKGVVAVMPFSKEVVICDYHDTVTSEAEGKQKRQSGFLFFIKGKETKALCIEAKASPCTCHPSLVIYGRMINHSKQLPNVKPHLHRIDFPDGPQEAVLFIAKRDIRPGEELLCDYSVTRAVVN
ncbi:uncharacterized protein LOC114844249 [Betta splendens]|uniref:Uncharacterized protein LOC114844249 n=1 Tax=Betta splendens TaxID=158456 RepID=A0A9W2XCK2_BETSP|nr:uncharacterized protein LOC114844249 [Betta splendens]XP_055359361.1 uncharacterized protein LOC114844249 [Betta splendens]